MMGRFYARFGLTGIGYTVLLGAIAWLTVPSLAWAKASDPAQDLDRSPRLAGQRGLDYLIESAETWQNGRRCYGCHVQGVATMGAAVSHRNEFKVGWDRADKLSSPMVRWVRNGGEGPIGHRFAGLFQAGVAFGFHHRYVDVKYLEDLRAAAAKIARFQESDGSFQEGRIEPPIDQGRIKATASSLISMIEADQLERAPRFANEVDRALRWLKTAIPSTTQDLAYKIIGLAWRREESPPSEVRQAADELMNRQKEDGGWGEDPELLSNAYATGLALFALRQSGVSIQDPHLVKATLFLIKTQNSDGSWDLVNSRSRRPSRFASTMHAVVGLGGVFNPKAEEEFLSLFRGRKKSRIGPISIALYLAFPIAVIGLLRRLYR